MCVCVCVCVCVKCAFIHVGHDKQWSVITYSTYTTTLLSYNCIRTNFWVDNQGFPYYRVHTMTFLSALSLFPSPSPPLPSLSLSLSLSPAPSCSLPLSPSHILVICTARRTVSSFSSPQRLSWSSCSGHTMRSAINVRSWRTNWRRVRIHSRHCRESSTLLC